MSNCCGSCSTRRFYTDILVHPKASKPHRTFSLMTRAVKVDHFLRFGTSKARLWGHESLTSTRHSSTAKFFISRKPLAQPLRPTIQCSNAWQQTYSTFYFCILRGQSLLLPPLLPPYIIDAAFRRECFNCFKSWQRGISPVQIIV